MCQSLKCISISRNLRTRVMSQACLEHIFLDDLLGSTADSIRVVIMRRRMKLSTFESLGESSDLNDGRMPYYVDCFILKVSNAISRLSCYDN